jgi:hypothetical protein
MKKKVLAVAAVGVMTLGLLTGCGSNTEVSRVDEDNVVVQDSEDTETEEPTEEETEEVTEEATEEELTWFEEQGLAITAQGDFTYVATAYDANDATNTETEFEVPASVTITETTDGVEDGYKNVIAVFTSDMSGSPEGYGWGNWASAFDRYTGTSFEYDNTTLYDTASKAGYITIQNGEDSYEVSIAFDTQWNESIQIFTITVTCPVDYDGAVFQIGNNSPTLIEINDTIDYSARLYTIDELPFYGDGYYYFSYTNE